MQLKRPSAATAIAFVALVIVVGSGSAVGASLITGRQIKNGSISGIDVRNKSLTPTDFRGSVKGDPGERGAPGPQGNPGPQGPPGPTQLGKMTRTEARQSVAPGDVNGPSAFCPSGQNIVSGGYITAGAGNGVFTQDSFGGQRWSVGYDNFNSSVSADVTAVAYCAPAGQAVTASTRSVRNDRAERRFDAALAAQLRLRRQLP